MGSGNSRGKKVAPASETDTADDSAQVDRKRVSSVEPRRVQPCTDLGLLHKKMPPDSRSDGQYSESSTDLEGELDEILAESDCQESRVNKKNSAKKHFFSSKTFGLCNYIRVRNDEDVTSTDQMPHVAGPHGGLQCSRAQSEVIVKEKQVCNKPWGKSTCASASQQVGNDCICNCQYHRI
ncbi:hypothetical protein ACEWY4_005281 [Coilia grayii]|uniref:Uncharacterized protein n=1 Tax=Coilia grayii TaxID=363190 RepID=A0ABD1KHV1_9TELE